MRIIVYDIEVFAYDWVVVFLDITTGTYTVYHNDNNGVREYMSDPDLIFCGFNNKFYDNYIVKAIVCGASPQLVKQINDFIIDEDRNGWDHWFIKQNRFRFNSFDLMNDTQQGTSLKHIEAHLGMNIEETQVDFNLDRPLTPEELESTIFYCKWDVRATAKLLTLRKRYLDCKIDLGRLCGLTDAESVYLTNALLAAKYLGATKTTRTDGREYVYPENMRTDIIPRPILEFFEQINDLSIPDDILFGRKLEIMIGDCLCTYAWGGVHGSLTKYHEKTTDTRVIENRDVSSLYPSLLDLYNYISRNCADPNKYRNTKNERLEAKRKGDKRTADALKNPLNVTSGAMDQKTNPLYDPRNARSMRISGQLFLTELVIELLTECLTLKLLNFNTDGLMYSVDRSELPKVNEICSRWEQRTRFELETDHIKEVWIKDVNGLMFIDDHGKIKTVGGYLNYGIAEKGGWKINNDHTIVKDAVIAYFAHGTPVEETIYGCDDIFKFQIIAKAGAGYKSVYRVPHDFKKRKDKWVKDNSYKVPNGIGKNGRPKFKTVKPTFKWHNYDGPRKEVQRVNRVYASVKPNMGTLVKVKPDGTVGKIGGLPDNCIIDNRNRLTLDDVDREWYVRLAKKYIEDYTGGN